ncbi:MAG: GNAT family N-acetyltransferase [Candidatus Omnitrophota bacterium]
MPNLNINITENINDINPHIWQKLFGSHPLRQYGYYKSIEQTQSKKFKFYYINFLKNNELIAIAPCFIMNFPIDFSLDKKYKRITNFISKIFYYLINIRTVFIGMPMSCQCDIAFNPEFQDKNIVLQEIIPAMKAIAKKENAWMIAFKDFPRQYQSFLKNQNFMEIETYPNARLDINFDSFEDYLKTLSYATRYDLRRKMKTYAGLKPLTLEIKKDCSECIDRIYQLYINTVNKNELHFDVAKKDYFLNIAKNMPEEIMYFIWKLDDKIVAFNQCFYKNDIMVGDFIGFDYNIVYKYNLYFVIFRDKIEWCIKNKIKVLDEGTFTLELKKRLKFKFYNNYFYMKPNFKLFEPIARIITPFFAPSDQDKQLKILKRFKKI